METCFCSHFGACGGCTYRDMTYESQLALKAEQVKTLLADYAGEGVWEPPVESPRRNGYRNKMEFTFGDASKDGPLELGMHQKGSFYNIVSVTDCQIVDADYRRILTFTRDFFRQEGTAFFHKKRHEGALRHLVVRKASGTGEILIMLVTVSSFRVPSAYTDGLLKLETDGVITGILQAKNDLPADTVQAQELVTLYGRDWFCEDLLGLSFKITPFSFFQTNSAGAEKLYEVVRDFAGGMEGKRVFDLYSGTGTIAQLLADTAAEVVGVELVPEAVEAAKENAERNRLTNCRFVASDVFRFLDSVAGDPGMTPDYIVLDPPREGIQPKALGRILSYQLPAIVYVSCKPTSLARDMEAFRLAGYEIRRVRCVDMFPWTKNIETVCLLINQNGGCH